MAETAVAICNRGLSQIAETQMITSLTPPGDGSTEATQCILWYDTMRQRLLRAAPWGFARTQKNPLTQVGDLYPDNTSPYPFLYAYSYPTDCLKLRYILAQPIPPNAGEDPPLTGLSFVGPGFMGPSRNNRFLIHNSSSGRIIITNVPNAIGVYTMDVTDPTLFDQLFTGALEDAISFKLIIPLSGNIAMQDKLRASADAALTTARAIDGNEAIPSSDPRVDWIDARGRGGYPFANWTGSEGGGWGNWYTGWEPMNWGM